MLAFATVVIVTPPPFAFTLVVIIVALYPDLFLLVELVPLDPGPRVRGPPAALEPPNAKRRALRLGLPAPEAVRDAPAVDLDAL